MLTLLVLPKEFAQLCLNRELRYADNCEKFHVY